MVRWALKNASTIVHDQSKVVVQKPVSCYYWRDSGMHAERCSFLYLSDNHAQNLKNVVISWLTVQCDEGIISRDVHLLCATLSLFNGEAFFIFSRSFFEKKAPIFDKKNIIESLLKTLRETGIPVRSVLFFVDDQVMVDEHLDFSCPWPIDGFSFQD